MYTRSPHGTTKIERRSLGTGTTAAMSLRIFDHGTVTWMPLAGRMEAARAPSSRVSSSSAQTPVAFTTAAPRTSGGVVHPERGAHGASDRAVDRAVLAEQRDEERQHADEVGRVAEQTLALGQRLVHEPDLALLEVAQPAVHELGRCARRKVALLDERDAQAAGGGVESDARAGDASADDHDVEGLVGEAGEGM